MKNKWLIVSINPSKTHEYEDKIWRTRNQWCLLTQVRPMFHLYRNQSIDLHSNSIVCFPYEWNFLLKELYFTLVNLQPKLSENGDEEKFLLTHLIPDSHKVFYSK